MGKLCPSCKQAEIVDLVPGIQQCPSCRKIFKDETPVKQSVETQEEILDGDYFMKNTSLNPKYEIADKGLTVAREKNKWWIAVLLCHTPNFPETKYIRISWWKDSLNAHGGMIKIEEHDELDNFIIALRRIDEDFDENFNPIKKISYEPIPGREDFDIDNYFNEKSKICPGCHQKMKLSKNHRYYECERCGEIIVIVDGKPIFNIPNQNLPLDYWTNFPVNFYLPVYGITTKLLMVDWKAVVIIYAKETPEKRWLRLYWWQRDLQSYISSVYSMGAAQGLRWEPKKGILSPNIHTKDQLKALIKSLERMKSEWVVSH